MSPDGTRIVLEGFARNLPQVSGIYSVRASDGGDLVRVTQGRDSYPQYSPDGRQIVFLRNKGGVQPSGAGALIVANADGSGQREITPWGYATLGYSWSPDGQWIVLQQPLGQLWLVHPDSTGLHQIPLTLPAGAGAVEPQWSPDGTRIAFSLRNASGANIFTVRPDGTGLQRVTHASGVQETRPDWGP